MGKGGKIRAKRPSRFFYLLLRENDGMINKEFPDPERHAGKLKEFYVVKYFVAVCHENGIGGRNAQNR